MNLLELKNKLFYWKDQYYHDTIISWHKYRYIMIHKQQKTMYHPRPNSNKYYQSKSYILANINCVQRILPYCKEVMYQIVRI